MFNFAKVVNAIAKRNFCPAFCQYSHSTIYSLSSGHGKCGVSIVRVSGPESKSALKCLIGQNFNPKPRYAYLKPIYHPESKEMIDSGLVLWFPGPNSFTGEDCCEFQVHGSIAVINYLLEALSTVPGLRLAKPGEYTKRSFYNGKMDLTEAEGLADLIHSETESQRKQALLQSTGALSKLYTKWRQKIIRNCAHLEAYIDFAEDENIEDNVTLEIHQELSLLKSEIEKHLDDNRQGEILRNGVRTAIIGSPNVGKSSFMNLLCQRDVSIVTATAGTTRDIIESSVNIGGFPVVFADTAGLRMKTVDSIEAEGISRAVRYVETADFVIILIEATTLLEFLNEGKLLKDYKEHYLKSLNLSLEMLKQKRTLFIINKIDLLPKKGLAKIETLEEVSCFSCKTNQNTEEVFESIKSVLQKMCGEPNHENPHLTKVRHRQNLNECVRNLDDFLQSFQFDTENIGMKQCPQLDANQDLAILAQKLRKAVRCIEQITGTIRTDDILDVIFRDFCIGK